MSVKSQLESILFVAIKPLTPKELANLTGEKIEEVKAALEELAADYNDSGRGLALIQNNSQYQLTTAAANSSLVKDFLKDETSGELSQPSLEALTIIAYRGPIAKIELEKIRGINCSLIIRNLLLRGLIEEKFNKTKNENYYTVTNDFIRFLGLNSLSDLPEYEKLNKLEALNSQAGETEKEVEALFEKNIAELNEEEKETDQEIENELKEKSEAKLEHNSLKEESELINDEDEEEYEDDDEEDDEEDDGEEEDDSVADGEIKK
jgi:segregation and condensation protein B